MYHSVLSFLWVSCLPGWIFEIEVAAECIDVQ